MMNETATAPRVHNDPFDFRHTIFVTATVPVPGVRFILNLCEEGVTHAVFDNDHDIVHSGSLAECREFVNHPLRASIPHIVSPADGFWRLTAEADAVGAVCSIRVAKFLGFGKVRIVSAEGGETLRNDSHMTVGALTRHVDRNGLGADILAALNVDYSPKAKDGTKVGRIVQAETGTKVGVLLDPLQKRPVRDRLYNVQIQRINYRENEVEAVSQHKVTARSLAEAATKVAKAEPIRSGRVETVLVKGRGVERQHGHNIFVWSKDGTQRGNFLPTKKGQRVTLCPANVLNHANGAIADLPVGLLDNTPEIATAPAPAPAASVEEPLLKKGMRVKYRDCRPGHEVSGKVLEIIPSDESAPLALVQFPGVSDPVRVVVKNLARAGRPAVRRTA